MKYFFKLNMKMQDMISGFMKLVGNSPQFKEETDKIPIVAQCDSTILISGETGTGKEMVAEAIHGLSPRANKPFVPVNCSSIPDTLVENELFGHVGGAFTGASRTYSGLVAEANGGTLFLDEVNSLQLHIQTKLLRLIQSGEYRQLGSSKVLCADIRIIGASNVDLEKGISEGWFRSDLFYRLNVIPISLPPLRLRTDDIPLLAQHFMKKYSARLNKSIEGFAPDAIEKLLAHSWPGNVRELENVIERAAVFTKNTILQACDIITGSSTSDSLPDEPFKEAKARVVQEFEQHFIKRLLSKYQGNITKAAQAAGKDRSVLSAMMKKHHIDASPYKKDMHY